MADTNQTKFRIISDQEPQVIAGRDDLFSATSVFLDAEIERPADRIFLQEQTVTDAQMAKGYEQAKAALKRPRCLCGAAWHDSWTAGVHHGQHRCARVITRVVPPYEF